MVSQTINLMSFASELPSAIYGALQPGMGPGQVIPGYTSNVLNGADFNLMAFNIVAQTISPITTIPATLVTNNPWSIGSANAFKTLTFSSVNTGPTAIQGPFLINSTSFDMSVINYSIPLNNIEIWTLNNQSPIAHPFHIHDVQFYITELNGLAPPPNMEGRKDVVLVPAMQTVKFITKFETFCDSMAGYMYHCHMLPHEDEGMMGQFVVTCPTGLGVSDLNIESDDILVFPNPSSSKITVKCLNNDLISEVAIYDYSGRIVFAKSDLNLNEFVFDLDSQPSGIYFIEIKTQEGINYRKLNLIK